jgi:drug/metabolite transporter (DMT)-like permease
MVAEAQLPGTGKNFHWLRTVMRATLGMAMEPAAHRLGSVLCVTSAVAFGALAIFGKLAFDAGVGILTLLFVRVAIAAPVLWVAALRRRGAFAAVGRRSVLAALALGAVGYAMQAGLYFAALERMEASVLSMVLYTYPAMVTLAAIVLGRETASRRRVGALLVSSGGLALVLLGAGGGEFDWLGAAMGLGAALTYTGYILVSDRVSGGLDTLPLSALVTTGAAVTFGVAGAASGSLDAGFAGEGWLWLTTIALVSTVMPIVLFLAGLRRVGPSMAAILSTLEPPTTVALAFLAFGESLTALQLAGAALVLGAVLLLHARPATVQPAPV